ncbi:MAG: citrate/2-methylcitrate synthase [Pseudomonadales bacterium]
MKQQPKINSSLEGVVVGETAISNVDGHAGKLSYRGINIEDLVNRPQWDIAARLSCSHEPSREELHEFSDFMRRHSFLEDHELELVRALDPRLHPMLMLQALMPALPIAKDDLIPLPLNASDIGHGYVLAAKIPALLCAWREREVGGENYHETYDVNEYDNPSASFLARFPGATNSALAIEILNATQVLQMEHSFNASTFAGRVCASTNAPIQSVLSVSFGTLYGSLHGGADQAALEMAQHIGGAENAEGFVADALARKQKIMGMGHREYKVVDPRAELLKPMARKLCNAGGPLELFETLVAVEQSCQGHFAKSGKQIWANVEYYKGAVFHALGIPSHYFTALFAMARVFGYLAHYEEFQRDARLIRPSAKYIGL